MRLNIHGNFTDFVWLDAFYEFNNFVNFFSLFFTLKAHLNIKHILLHVYIYIYYNILNTERD